MIGLGVFCDNPDAGFGVRCLEAEPLPTGDLSDPAALLGQVLARGWGLVALLDGTRRVYCPECTRVADAELDDPHGQVAEVRCNREVAE